MAFNPYHKWLGITNKRGVPTYYELLVSSLAKMILM